ncbi:MAG: HAD-IB family phosphatase [Planctomycetota bacterium]
MPASATHLTALPFALPRPECAQAWLDFDGTITRGDFLDLLISKYSRNDSWKLIEERWRLGLIGSAECLSLEFGLLDITPEQLAAELDAVQLDPGAIALFRLLREFGVPVSVLSDGIDSFIIAILNKAGVALPTIRANRITHAGHRLTLSCPHSSRTCESASAHCKCASKRDLGDKARTGIYVGDGRSDLCAARKASIVFAKGSLAQALASEGRAFVRFDTLLDVEATLRTAWVPMIGVP